MSLWWRYFARLCSYKDGTRQQTKQEKNRATKAMELVSKGETQKGSWGVSRYSLIRRKETGHLSQRFLQDTVLVFPLNTNNIRQKKAQHGSSHARLLFPDHFLSPSLLTCPFHLLLSLVQATPHLFSIPRGTVFSLNTLLLFVSQSSAFKSNIILLERFRSLIAQNSFNHSTGWALTHPV